MLDRRGFLIAGGVLAVGAAGLGGARLLSSGGRVGSSAGASGSAGAAGATGSAGIGGAASATGAAGTAGAAAGSGAAHLQRIGIQLYTLRSAMAEDVERTLARVAEIGYDEVEFAGYFGRDPAALRRVLAAEGLTAPAAHVGFDVLGDGWAEVLDTAAAVGHDWVVVPWMPNDVRSDLDALLRVAELFNEAGEAARAAGLRFAYHNHDFEFPPVDGRVPFDLLIEETDPDLVAFEMDVFWTRRGGADPLDYFDRYPGRFPLLHLKDIDADGNMVDVGAGIIDFGEILERAGEDGLMHGFVEHDNPTDPFETARAAFEHLRGV